MDTKMSQDSTNLNPGKYSSQKKWKKATGFEQWPERKAKKADWARKNRATKKKAKQDQEKLILP